MTNGEGVRGQISVAYLQTGVITHHPPLIVRLFGERETSETDPFDLFVSCVFKSRSGEEGGGRVVEVVARVGKARESGREGGRDRD